MSPDDTYLKDAQSQRDHDRRMAEAKREFRGAVLIGIALVAVALAIIGAIIGGVIHSNDNKLKIEREHTTQERMCVEASNIWVNGTCIPSRGAR